MDTTRVAAIYISVSNRSNVTEIMRQEKLLEAYALQQGIVIGKKIHSIGEDFSVFKSSLLELKTACLNGEVNCIMMTGLDRISRDKKVVCGYVNDIYAAGASVVIPGIDMKEMNEMILPLDMELPVNPEVPEEDEFWDREFFVDEEI